MSINALMNRLARIEGRIENIKQRIGSLAGGDAFSAHFNKAVEKFDQNPAVKVSGDSDVVKSGESDSVKSKNFARGIDVKMPRITFDKALNKGNAQDGGAASSGVVSPPSIDLKNTALTPEIGSIIMEKSGKHQIDPLLVSAIMAVESDFNPRAVSAKGAVGLMQLMPETAEELGVNPHNLSQNIEGGTLYIKQMLDKFSGDLKLALAAYNAGPNAVLRHGGVPPFAETQSYVLRVLENYENYLKQSANSAAGDIFAADDEVYADE